jgi:hypothetical protein
VRCSRSSRTIGTRNVVSASSLEVLTARARLRTIVVMRVLPWLMALGLCGCFMANTSPAKKLSETVQDLNEQARWGRLTDAANLVEPAYRNAFLSAHQQWGSEIKLADTEVLHVQIAPGAEHANAIVNYSWYAIETMTLHETTVRQRWSAYSGGYALTSEAVVRGDPRLLHVPAAGEASEPPGMYKLD